jgi:hypothetical protein
MTVWIDYNKDGDFSDAGGSMGKAPSQTTPFQVHLL